MTEHKREWWRMACWNGLSEIQQRQLIERGALEFGYEPEGTACYDGAEVAIEIRGDKAPGPRFYCPLCAIDYLASNMTDDALALIGLVREHRASRTTRRERKRERSTS
jgi:hypothetical protein